MLKCFLISLLTIGIVSAASAQEQATNVSVGEHTVIACYKGGEVEFLMLRKSGRLLITIEDEFGRIDLWHCAQILETDSCTWLAIVTPSVWMEIDPSTGVCTWQSGDFRTVYSPEIESR